MYFGQEQLEIVSLQFKKQRTRNGGSVIVHPVAARGDSGTITIQSIVVKNGSYLDPQLTKQKEWLFPVESQGEYRILAFGRIGAKPFCVDTTFYH